ncbi:SBBP repeat-containing protein, partial [candidate division KSB1 bacterium]|nr:SBBP repeat-containing protein [candidate division KSB1 bacterium]
MSKMKIIVMVFLLFGFGFSILSMAQQRTKHEKFINQNFSFRHTQQMQRLHFPQNKLKKPDHKILHENRFYQYQQLSNSRLTYYLPFSPTNYHANLRNVHKPQIPMIPNLTNGVKEEWVRTYESKTLPSWESATDIAIDKKSNVYVTGYSTNMPHGLDYYTIKYDTDGNQIWGVYFNGEINGDDMAKKIGLDDDGNVYVGGISSGAGSASDFVVVKYNSLGQQLWAARYQGINNGDDVLQDMAVDDFGNVYLIGESDDCFVTIKINNKGIQQWDTHYRGPGNYDSPRAIALDEAGNIYVTGFSEKYETSYFCNCITLKFNANGEQIWQARYASTGSRDNKPKDIAVDESGAVFVTGNRYINGSYDFFTIKYDSNGQELWTDIYDGAGNFLYDDFAKTINLDNKGNIYVTGSSVDNSTHHNLNLATIKYKNDGGRQWVAQYQNGLNNDSRAVDASLDSSGNVYVLGYGDSEYEGDDYLVIKYSSNGSQVWEARYHSYSWSWSQPKAVAVNDRGDVFLTGERDDSQTAFDYITVKFDADGIQQWVRDFNGTYRDDGRAVALQLDENGNVITFGRSGNNFVTTKHSAQGTFKWAATFDGREYSSGTKKSLAQDRMGNIFVTAANRPDTAKWDYDFVTLKYNSNGVQQWIARYDKDECQDGCDRYNIPTAIVVDQAGSAYVTGRSRGQSGSDDIVTIKYNANGVEQWINRFRSKENSYITVTDLTIDNWGNIIVSGIVITDESKIFIIKYDTKGGQQWLTTTPDETSYYMGASIKLDDWGNTYVLSNRDKSCMLCAMADFDNCVILKYNSAGEKQWITECGETDNPFIGGDIEIDILGNVYICGGNWHGHPYDIFVIKKYNADGVELWTTQSKKKDYWGFSSCLILDRECNAYIAGDISNTGCGTDVFIIKFNSRGQEKWSLNYNDPRNSNDIIRDMKIDKFGNIFAAGSANGAYWINYKIMKFSQTGADTLTTPIITGYELQHNIPNPFKKQTLIYYTLPKASKVKIKVFNQLGQQVAFED